MRYLLLLSWLLVPTLITASKLHGTSFQYLVLHRDNSIQKFKVNQAITIWYNDNNQHQKLSGTGCIKSSCSVMGVSIIKAD